MIPRGHIQQWAAVTPWPDLRQVEQDLIISRALCDLFADEFLRDKNAFRGGTAIHKLMLPRPLRYSEDIDLVQTRAEPIGPVIDRVTRVLSWLGRCKRSQSQHSTTLVFRFTPEESPGESLRLKIEINTREHGSRNGLCGYAFEMVNDWHRARVAIMSFDREELLGTKLRALLQRNKNRDLFDLHEALLLPGIDHGCLIDCFEYYLEIEGRPITRAVAEERMLKKLSKSLAEDVVPLLPAGTTFDEPTAIVAFGRIWQELISKLPGEPWKSSRAAIAEIRATKIPTLLDGVVD